MPTQPLGWFKKEIKSGDDFKGMSIVPSACRPTCSRNSALR